MLNWDPKTNNVVIPKGKETAVSPLYPANISVVTGDVQMHPGNRNFVPRIGAAYRVTNRFVIRGGYGIFNETLGRYARLQGAVVGQQEQPLAVVVEAPGRVDAGHRHVVGEGRPSTGIGELAEHAEGLVEEDQHRGGVTRARATPSAAGPARARPSRPARRPRAGAR